MGWLDVGVSSNVGGVSSSGPSGVGGSATDAAFRSGNVNVAVPLGNLGDMANAMLAPFFNGGSLEEAPNRILSMIESRNGSATGGSFSVDLGGFGGSIGVGTIAVVAAGVVGLIFFARRRRG